MPDQQYWVVGVASCFLKMKPKNAIREVSAFLQSRRLLVGFIIALAVAESSCLVVAAIARFQYAPSEAQMRSVASGMSRAQVHALLGEPRWESPSAWHYSLPFGIGDYRSILSGDTFQVYFADSDRVFSAYCGD